MQLQGLNTCCMHMPQMCVQHPPLHARISLLQETIAALRQQLQQQQQKQQRPPQAGRKKLPPPCPVQITASAVAAAGDVVAAADTSPSTAHPFAATKDKPAPAATTGGQCPGKAEAKAAAAAAAAAEVAALKGMEAQLMRLSATVKSYTSEREQLRHALMTGCAERQVLQQQVQELEAKLKMQGCSGLAKGADGVGKQEADNQQAAALSRVYWGSLTH
jgi:hypothetical protein